MADDVTITVGVNDRTGTGFRDVNGRLQDMRGRFATAAGGMRRASDDMDRSMTTLRSSTMSLMPELSGVGAAVGVSLLPALGAAVPAAIGLGAAAGTLKLGLAGVSDAVALAGQDTKKYNETLKKMGPEQRDFTKALVDVKGQFGGLGREIQKAARDQRAVDGEVAARDMAGSVEGLAASCTAAVGAVVEAMAAMGRALGALGEHDRLVRAAAADLGKRGLRHGEGEPTGANLDESVWIGGVKWPLVDGAGVVGRCLVELVAEVLPRHPLARAVWVPYGGVSAAEGRDAVLALVRAERGR